MPKCAHTMKATGADGVTYCCDCGKEFRLKPVAPHPPSDPAAEAVSALREEIEDRIALLYNPMPDMSGRQINRLHGENRRRVQEFAAEIADRFAALRTRAEEAEAKGARDFWEAEAHGLNVEVDLIDLARMYGKACGDLMQEAADHRQSTRSYDDAYDLAAAMKADRDRLATELAEARAEVARLSKFADFALLWCDRGPPHGGPGNEAAALGFIRHHPVLSARRRALTTAKGDADVEA